MQLLDETRSVLSLGKHCKDHGCSYEWVSGQESRWTKNGRSIICKTNIFVPLVVQPREEQFGDLITADHKVLNEGSESRENHRHTVVVQDLVTRWVQSYLCKTKILT